MVIVGIGLVGLLGWLMIVLLLRIVFCVYSVAYVFFDILWLFGWAILWFECMLAGFVLIVGWLLDFVYFRSPWVSCCLLFVIVLLVFIVFLVFGLIV